MIVSHKYKFIFIHCRKTAGSSIAISLSRYLGDDDIQLSGIVDGARYGMRPPRRMIREALLHPNLTGVMGYARRQHPFWEFVSTSIKRRYQEFLGPVPQHAPAINVAKYFSEEWANYYKFCVVRNPWAQVLSDYHWQSDLAIQGVSFNEYVQAIYSGTQLKGMGHPDRGNWNKYTINDSIAVDRVIRYESLAQGLRKVVSEIGLEWDGWLPQAKRLLKNRDGSGRNYRDYYSLQTKKMVEELYTREIKQHEYSF